mmetsp:Transcript_1542/g.4787  ORF Transcript_1542/g.4787 Transcript_1542/m.4787 type:complete len:264 (+) Transcript_1542:274-1065(+)
MWTASQVSISQWIFLSRSNFTQHGLSMEVEAGDVKLGIEVSQWPFAELQNQLCLLMSYNASSRLINEPDPCQDPLPEVGVVHGEPIRDALNAERLRFNSTAGLRLSVAIASVALLDQRLLVPVNYTAYSNGSLEVCFPSFERTLGYDPSLRALFGGLSDECDETNVLLTYILPGAFFGACVLLGGITVIVVSNSKRYVLSAYVCTVTVRPLVSWPRWCFGDSSIPSFFFRYLYRVRRIAFGKEAMRVEGLRKVRASQIASNDE